MVFDSLSPEQQKQVQDILGELRVNSGRLVRIRIEQGQRLLRLKAVVGHGGWLSWLISGDANSGYKSIKTVERDMMLAEALTPHLIGLTDDMLSDLTNLTAMRELSGDENADALDTAIHLMKQGIRVNGGAATKLSAIHAVSPELGIRVRDGKITVDDAYAVARRIDEVKPAQKVVDLIVQSGVKSGGVVDALSVMHDEQRMKFEEVVASGSIYNAATGQEVPLGEASLADATLAVNDEDAERERRRREYIQAWRDEQPERIAVISGTRAEVIARLAEVITAEESVKIYVYPQAVAEHAD